MRNRRIAACNRHGRHGCFQKPANGNHSHNMASSGNSPQRPSEKGFNYSELTIWEKITIISPVPPKIVLLLLLTGVLLLAAYYFSLFAIHGFSPDFLKINRCLESGGRWNAVERRCEQVQDVYIPPDPAMQPY